MKNLLSKKIRKNFGKAIRNLRLSRNLTQEELSAEIGVSREWISKIECGKSSPNWLDLLIFMIVIKFETIEEVNLFLKEATSGVFVHTL
ncbi:MAG: helix-turn-helix domain-containing protein [Clostridiales bacterium]|nr:helix-turn-helix domain-containing protein [Clostridiales bacterium]